MVELIFSFDGTVSLGPFNYDIPEKEFYIEWIDEDYYNQLPRQDKPPEKDYNMFILTAALIFNCNITSSYYYCEKVTEPTFMGYTLSEDDFKKFQNDYASYQMSYDIKLCKQDHSENTFSYVPCFVLEEKNDGQDSL